jgi:hypothetical protein
MIANGGPRPAPSTLTSLFFVAIEKYDLPNAYQYKRDGKYTPIAARDVLQRVRRVSGRSASHAATGSGSCPRIAPSGPSPTGPALVAG